MNILYYLVVALITFSVLLLQVYAILGVISLFQEFSDSDQNIPIFELGPVSYLRMSFLPT